VARSVIQPAELRVGIVTAALGAPFFLILIHRSGPGRGRGVGV
jgi:ABC-type Fe3+-siderophore transport system permease subunit